MAIDLLSLIPEIGKIADNLISTNDDKRKFELAVKEIDIREVEARLGVQKAWLGNNSIFVAGAIPSILWMVSLVIFFNHILAPISAWCGTVLPVLDLPPWYANLAGTVVLGLFSKKAFDGAEINWNGQTVKPAKERVQEDIKAQSDKPKPNYDDPEYIDKRFKELSEKQYNSDK